MPGLIRYSKGYGDVRSSMLQDIERGRITEIDFINGYVVSIASQFSVPTPVNAAIVETVHAITRGRVGSSTRRCWNKSCKRANKRSERSSCRPLCRNVSSDKEAKQGKPRSSIDPYLLTQTRTCVKFSKRELVELSSAIAWENYRARFKSHVRY